MVPYGKLPKMPPGGALFSRGKFLSGHDARTFFGPGQRPDAVASYSPPRAWPPAGSLLRPPQVVWLSALGDYSLFFQAQAPPGGFAPPPSPFPPLAERYLQDVNPFLATGDPSMSAPGVPPYYYASVPNEALSVYRTMVTKCRAVADRLNALRPDRTYALPIDWISTAAADSPVSPPYPALTGTVADLRLRYVVSPPSYLHLWSPAAADPGDYFGTDFLHVYLGYAVQNVPGGWNGLAGFYVTEHFDWLAVPPYPDSERALHAHASRFVRFAVRAYGHREPWPPWPPWPGPGDHFAGPLGGTFNQSLALLNERLVAAPDASAAVLQATCAAAAAAVADADVRYQGDQADAGVDDLVGLVAAHFGFDPDTGRDL